MRFQAAVPALVLVMVAGCAGGAMKGSTLERVQSVELESYLGTWYEIARSSNKFQKDCHGSTARYTLRDDGKIAVLSSCRKGGRDGKLEQASGSPPMDRERYERICERLVILGYEPERLLVEDGVIVDQARGLLFLPRSKALEPARASAGREPGCSCLPLFSP